MCVCRGLLPGLQTSSTRRWHDDRRRRHSHNTHMIFSHACQLPSVHLPLVGIFLPPSVPPLSSRLSIERLLSRTRERIYPYSSRSHHTAHPARTPARCSHGGGQGSPQCDAGHCSDHPDPRLSRAGHHFRALAVEAGVCDLPGARWGPLLPRKSASCRSRSCMGLLVGAASEVTLIICSGCRPERVPLFQRPGVSLGRGAAW